jgi:DNA gyrase/topoisomerase IV subunit A
MTSFTNKIDEWMQEAEERPESAVMLVRLIARRLRELTERDEELLAENIALQNGTRVEEYQKRIAHLEYQLELLKRRFSLGEGAFLEVVETAETPTVNVLAYNSYGRILRVEVDSIQQTSGRITDQMTTDREPARLLCIPSNEEVLLLFTSGRVSTHKVSEIPMATGDNWSWEGAALPDEPRAGEWLACIMPFSHLPLSDYFLQVSRRGCVKSTMTSLAQSVLSNHYLGKGSIQKSDQPLDIILGQKKDRFAFVTCEGKLLGLDVDALAYSAEERIRLTTSDFVVASFLVRQNESMIFVTQTGKVIQRESESLEVSKSPLAKGQSLISISRLDQGVRFVGAASVKDKDRIAVLDATGSLTVHIAESIVGAGSIEADGLTGEAVAIGVIPADSVKRSES